MPYTVVGILRSYADAESAVRDLELAGIVGEQVEVISDIDEDARTVDTPGEPSTRHGTHHSGIARLFEKPEVRDLSGEQSNYIGEQEFYATHVKRGGAVIVVRTSTEQSVNRGATILRDHGARTH